MGMDVCVPFTQFSNRQLIVCVCVCVCVCVYVNVYVNTAE